MRSRKFLVKGLLTGVLLSLAIGAFIGVYMFDGECGFSLGFGGNYECTFGEYLVDPIGLWFTVATFLLVLWYIPLTIILASIIFFYWKAKTKVQIKP